jgi:hypothetical protein
MTTDGRPNEIAWFERLGFGAVAIGVIESTLTLDRSPDGSHTNLDISVYVLFTLMAALIWLVARKRSRPAKWILVVLVGLTTLFWLLALPTMMERIAFAVLLLSSLQFIAQAAAVFLLFTRPARIWMDAKAPGSPGRTRSPPP